MNLHLLVPALFWPEASLPEIYHDLPVPALENLLAKSLFADDESQQMEAWLCRAFGVSKQQDWPVAPITLQADGAGNVTTGNDYWIRADPVHLRIERNQIVLADSRAFPISREEADQFTGLLNRHFAGNGLEIVFLPLQPDRWYVRTEKIHPASTRLLSETVNKGINELLPFGANNIFWRGLFNEIQMLLHEHPLNQAREARGELAINSAWFWGGGILPKSVACSYAHIWSNDILAGSLAQACGTVAHWQLPSDAEAWRRSAAWGDHLVVLDTLLGKAQYGDAYGWREGLKELERNWFAPLWVMTKQGNLDQITLTAVHEGKTRSFSLQRGDWRKLWRRPKPLSTYAG